jgi:rhodanese-related sulfurtransferase
VTKVTDKGFFYPDLCIVINYQKAFKSIKAMFNIFGSKPKNYENLDGTTFRNRYQSEAKAELLDVRTAGEFAGGSIKGARNLDVTSPQFQQALKTMDKDKAYFVYCRSGNRSGSACDIMSKEGFKAYNLAGGIGSWPI